jgi:hypothetical protein
VPESVPLVEDWVEVSEESDIVLFWDGFVWSGRGSEWFILWKRGGRREVVEGKSPSGGSGWFLN